MLELEVKEKIKKEFGRHEKDTGSPEVQIALITKRIEALTQHFNIYKKDFNSRRGLLKLIGHRRALLGYLHKINPPIYQTVLEKLNLRK
ncbi:MAG: 30S ribosomal protein S15 [Candidatus Omnitrophica bacterium]|nr:30S ribosomal protein S15 [Candidatus Omnitrophota bacterium]